MKRSLPLLLGVAGACVALDQWTKHWATTALAGHAPIRVVDDLVRLTYARNSGIAFSLLAGRGLPLYVFSIVAAIVVFALFLRQERLPLSRQLALALILGGAIGNLIDRVTTGLVVDFILLSWGVHEFPVFNVADSAVTCGVLLFAFAWTREPQAHADEAAAAPDPRRGDDGSAWNEPDGGPGGAGAGGGTEGGPLAGEGTNRPLA